MGYPLGSGYCPGSDNPWARDRGHALAEWQGFAGAATNGEVIKSICYYMLLVFI